MYIYACTYRVRVRAIILFNWNFSAEERRKSKKIVALEPAFEANFMDTGRSRSIAIFVNLNH